MASFKEFKKQVNSRMKYAVYVILCHVYFALAWFISWFVYPLRL